MSPQRIRTGHDSDMLIMAFEYAVISQSLYNRLQDDFKLPSLRTLTALASEVTKLDDFNFPGVILVKSLKIRKSIFLDEVHDKFSLLYHGGYLFDVAYGRMRKWWTKLWLKLQNFIYGNKSNIYGIKSII